MVDYTQQYVSKIINNLTSQGIIKISGKINIGRGQPIRCLKVCADYTYSVGISLMTDSVSLVLIDMSGLVLCEHTYPYTYTTIEDFCHFIEISIDKIAALNNVPRNKLVGVGVGITGFFTGKNRQVNAPKQLAELAFQDIDEALSQKLKLPVVIDNDGNTAAVAEIMYGIGVSTKSFAYFYISAGLGGGIVINGELYRGNHGNAGEFANIIPNTKSYPTLATLKKSYETQGVFYLTIDELLNNLDINDPIVKAWIKNGSESLTTFVSAISAILDPEKIVLGGRIPTSLSEKVIDHIEIYNSDRQGDKKPTPKVVPSKVKGEPTAMGAAILPLLNSYYA